MLRQISNYVGELRFALQATDNWPDCFLLTRNTLRFHLHNGLRKTNNHSKAFTINVRISKTTTVPLIMRPFAGDLFIFYEVLALESYRLPNCRLQPHKARVIIDGGANIGITSLYFAAKYPSAMIYSIEPLPANFELLKANVAPISRIKPINACLTGLPQKSVLFSTSGPAWGNRIGADGISVPALSLQELCELENIERVDLLKLDIEGGERDVLSHGQSFERVQHIIIELHDDYDFEAFQRAVRSFGMEARPPCLPEMQMVTAFRRPSNPAFGA